MALVMVESEYNPPVDLDKYPDPDEVLVGCMQVRQIRWLRSFLSADGSRSVCCFEAVDAETVREAFRRANTPFVRVWSAREFSS